jgi:L-arabinose isomerase
LPKIGFLALAARWFWDTRMSDLRFAEEAQSQIMSIEASLSASHQVISGGLVTTEESAKSAADKFREANVDALIVCCLMWSEDQPLLRVLEELVATPLLLWCWTPGTTLPEGLTALDLIRWSGPVGAQQISGALRRSGRRFTFVIGNHHETETIQEIQNFISAAAAARSLRHARVGLLPHRYDVMTNTWVDEFDLMSRIGMDVIYISVGQLASSAALVEDVEVKMYIEGLKGMPIDPQVTRNGLSEATRISLGLAKIIKDKQLDAISIGDCNDELHAVLKCRPCLYLPAVFESGVVVGSEGDLRGTLAQLILARLSGQPTLFTEIFTYDEQRNQILVGHAGMHDIRLAGERSAVTITPDYEYPQEEAGVWMSFSVKPGPVTLLSVTSDQTGFRFVVTRGEALPAKGKLQGYPNALIQLEMPLKSFFSVTTTIGTTQHWALVPGDLRSCVSKLAYVLGIECTILDGT